MPTVTFQVNSKQDDGHIWYDMVQTSLTNDSMAVQIGYPFDGDYIYYNVGYTRFAGVTIPQGATITSAYLEVNAPTGSNTAGTMKIQGEKSTNASVISDINAYENRSKTTATATWAVGSNLNGVYQTSDIKTVIQEIVSQSGWISGNALQLFLTFSSNMGNLAIRPYETGAAAAAKLIVTYTEPIIKTFILQGEENDGHVMWYSNFLPYDINLNATGGMPDNAWLRFTNVTIPKGATISSAVLAFPLSGGNWFSFDIYAEKADNPSAPTSIEDYNSRVRTTAKIPLSQASSWGGGLSKDITPVVVEIISRAGWNSGNALQILLYTTGNTSGDFGWSGDETTPSLTITYTSEATESTSATVTVPLATVTSNSPTPVLTAQKQVTVTATLATMTVQAVAPSVTVAIGAPQATIEFIEPNGYKLTWTPL